MTHFKIDSFVKKVQWWSPWLIQIVLTEFFRLLDGLASRSFCRWDILKVQLKSNWTVGERSLASGSRTVWKSRLILSKVRLNVFNGWFGNCIISKELALKNSMDDLILHSGNCSDIHMALQTDQFVDRTFWKSNWSPTEHLVKGR